MCRSIIDMFHCWVDLRRSLSPFTRLVPLLLYTFSGTPRRAKKHWKPAIKEAAVKLWATSRYTALVVRHVNKHPYLFKCVRPAFTISRPKLSIPTNENGGLSGNICSSSKGAICCVHNGACWRLHRMQTFRTFFTALCPLTIQYLSGVAASTCCIRTWLLISWRKQIISVVTWCPLGSMIGNLFMVPEHRSPFKRTSPSTTTSLSNAIWLSFFTGFPFFQTGHFIHERTLLYTH